MMQQMLWLFRDTFVSQWWWHMQRMSESRYTQRRSVCSRSFNWRSNMDRNPGRHECWWFRSTYRWWCYVNIWDCWCSYWRRSMLSVDRIVVGPIVLGYLSFFGSRYVHPNTETYRSKESRCEHSQFGRLLFSVFRTSRYESHFSQFTWISS